MTRAQLIHQIRRKKSYLCIGLDTDLTKIPQHLLKEADPVFEFNRQIIDATHGSCVAYKLNMAFYETLGASGWGSLEKTVAHIPKDIFTIADAKRGDIGNTSILYAKAFFDRLSFDALTVAPYMGEDSVKPFLTFTNKWVILLAHTSNPGSADFQLQESRQTGRMLFEDVIVKSQSWGNADNMMYVVGATRADHLVSIRKLAPDHFFLVPGIGAQGGDLELVSRLGMNKDCGLLVNSSRAIIYTSSGKDFAEAAAFAANKLKFEMSQQLESISGF